MPCTYVIDKQRRLVLSKALGIVTAAELLAHQNQLRSDVDFDRTFFQLLNGSGITKLEVDQKDVQLLAAREMFSAESRRAFVAGSEVVFGIARMFEIYRELSGVGEHIRIFQDVNAALQWLGLTAE